MQEDELYDHEKHRYKRPYYSSGCPDLVYTQIREDAWECGDKSLLDKAGSYFTRLWNYQRKQQAKWRRKELKRDGHWVHPFVFYYPIQNWFQEGLKLKTFDQIKKYPFLSLYDIELPKFTDPRKYTFYNEDIQTLTIFPYDKSTHHYGHKHFIFLPQH